MLARAFILRAAIAGAVGGLVAFLIARILAEPLIQQAIDYEEQRGEAEEALAAAAGRAPGEAGAEVFTRTVQETPGLAVGVIGVGIALGLLYAVVYTALHGKVGLRPRVLALLVAGAGFLTLYATPFLKYPASPPAVGHDESLGTRVGLYLAMIIGSVVFLTIAVYVGRALAARVGAWNAWLAGIGVYVVLSGVLMVALPSLGELAVNVETYGPAVAETPMPLLDPAGNIVFPGFDPDVLYYFRLYAVAAQFALWAVLGLVFGALAERFTGGQGSDGAVAERTEPVQA